MLAYNCLMMLGAAMLNQNLKDFSAGRGEYLQNQTQSEQNTYQCLDVTMFDDNVWQYLTGVFYSFL